MGVENGLQVIKFLILLRTSPKYVVLSSCAHYSAGSQDTTSNAITQNTSSGVLDVTAKCVARAQDTLDKSSLYDIGSLRRRMCVVNGEEAIDSCLSQGDESVSNVLSMIDEGCTAADVRDDLSAVLGESRW